MGINISYCAKRFKRSIYELTQGLSSYGMRTELLTNLSNDINVISRACLLRELIAIRDHEMILPQNFLSNNDIVNMLDFLCCN